MPWWAALLIATTATAIGYAIDAGLGHKELTDAFAALYIAGCVVAVLAVRQSGVFTAVIQPPLILFCAVPGAYWLFHGGKVSNLKDVLINCGYPLIERFPLMLGTAGGVLLIGLIRWYFRLSHRTTAPANTTDDAATTTESESRSVIRDIAAKLASILGRDADDEDTGAPSADAPGSTRSAIPPKPAERPAAVGPPRGPPEPAPGILDRRWRRSTNRRSSGGGTQAAGAQRPLATSNPPTRPVAHAATPGRRAIPTCAPSRHGKCAETRMAGVVPTSGRSVAAAASIPMPSTSVPTSSRTNRTSHTSRRAVAPRQMGQTAPARRTTRSRRSATAGQPRGTNVETSTARSPAPSAVVARAHHVGTRLKTGIATSSS